MELSYSADRTQPPPQQVIVVGAGPSGLLAALLLRKHGIPVRVLEASDELDKQPRAAHYGPPAVPDLDRAGVLGEARRRGLTLNTMCWRRLEDHSLIAGFDCEVLKDCTFDSGTADREAQGGGGVRGHTKDLRTTCLVLQDLDKLMLDMFLEAGGEVSWKHQVVDVGQDGDEAWVDVLVGDEKKKERIGGNYYILGCDGANSQVRKSLFGQEYPGWTWDAQIVATNVSVRPEKMAHGKQVANNYDTRPTTPLRRSLDSTTPTLSSTRSTST